jgi:hypothetical protein
LAQFRWDRGWHYFDGGTAPEMALIMVTLADFDPQYIHDGVLGGPGELGKRNLVAPNSASLDQCQTM